jgi:hypothetical protein
MLKKETKKHLLRLSHDLLIMTQMHKGYKKKAKRKE